MLNSAVFLGALSDCLDLGIMKEETISVGEGRKWKVCSSLELDQSQSSIREVAV